MEVRGGEAEVGEGALEEAHQAHVLGAGEAARACKREGTEVWGGVVGWDGMGQWDRSISTADGSRVCTHWARRR